MDAGREPTSEPTAHESVGPPAHQPLAGLRVVDLSRYLPGPLLTRILGDLGADVVKIEEPKLGDPIRHLPPTPDGITSLAALLLAGHRSVALDLKKPKARACLASLLAEADVLVESFRPGTLARFDLAPEALRQRFPRLVIWSVSGWGQEGPYADRAGHDLAYQAVAGSLAACPTTPAVPVADMVGAWSGATAVLAALRRRDQDGEGCWIDQALVDAAGHANITGWASEAGGARSVAEPLPLTGGLAGYQVYRTRDDQWLALAALEPRFWRRFCKVVERPGWVVRQTSSDEAFHAEVASVIGAHDLDHWTHLMAEHDIPGEPVLSLAAAQAHPQVALRGLLTEDDEGRPRLGYPARFDGERPSAARAAVPTLGADTAEVLTAHGHADALDMRTRWTGGVGRRPSVRGWLRRVVGAVRKSSRTS